MTSAATDFSAEPAADALREQLIEGKGGRLRVAHARSMGRARATVVALPGRGELVEKYRPLAHEITGWGYDFFMLDWRGQGASWRLLPDPRKGHVVDFRHYLEDLGTALEHLQALDLAPPRLLLGHSMGGHIALRALGEGILDVRAAALIAPMVDIDFKRLPPWLARGIARSAVLLGQAARYAPGQARAQARYLRFENNPLTTDSARFEDWRRLIETHEQHSIAGVTYGWLDAALRSIALTRHPTFLCRITTPCLIVTAERERIVDNRAALDAARHLPSAEVMAIPEALHDLFLAAERERTQLMRTLHGFFGRFG
jgi:lysophospholipase